MLSAGLVLCAPQVCARDAHMDMAAEFLGGRQWELSNEEGGQVTQLPYMDGMEDMVGLHIVRVCTGGGMAIRGQSACPPEHRNTISNAMLYGNGVRQTAEVKHNWGGD